MDRVAQLEVLDPLGFDNPSAMVVRARGTEKFATLSDAAGLDKRWRLGVTYEFQSRSDGLQELAAYRLSMGSPRILDPKQLFAALANGDVDMIAARATDGHLMSPDWKILADDRKVFPPYEACLLVRKDLIAAEPGVRPALAELSGKISADTMRKLNAEVDVKDMASGHRGRRVSEPSRVEVDSRSFPAGIAKVTPKATFCGFRADYATGCGSGRTPSCRRHRSIHCLVSFSCTPFCERRVRSVPQST